MKQQLNALLQKDMSRKEFLVTVGLGLVSMTGFASALKFLLESNTTKTVSTTTTTKQSAGYGNSAYGR